MLQANDIKNRLISLSGVFLGLLLVSAPVFSGESSVEKKKVDAVIETKFGNIELQMFPEVAPKHVNNFLKLAKAGFYNGTTFHRVIPGFMIQGGDPNSRQKDRTKHGTGGPGYTIVAEFNDRHHVRGALSMARSSDPNSAGSQFFIVVKESRFLDRQYTVFGEVVSGMDVADKIVSQKRDARDNPIERIEMRVCAFGAKQDTGKTKQPPCDNKKQ